MLTTIEGTYNNGVVILNEQPPTTKTTKVFVTFTEEVKSVVAKPTNWATKYKGAMTKQPLTDIDNQLKELRNEWE